MISEEHKNLLFKASIFSGLSPDQMTSVLDTVREVSYGEGEIIMNEGDEGGELFVIVEGSIQIEKKAGDNFTIKIARTEQRGMLIGEMSLIDMKPRSATVRADSPVTLLGLKREDLAVLFDEDPKVLATISLNIARLLSDRLRHSNDMFAELFSHFTA
ncbi:MAG: cyclic nucleotide-binding domain-containing protein [Candidatus Marinimicrobia bacterium]|nr:cyclic nucleotide-binding domain-containing protein [Candidatus Neomarinimicrobiota bacterium]